MKLGQRLNANKNDKRLLSNTLMMYIMTFSAQLFNFITMPYLTRVLGPTVYGKSGIATSYMAYVQIIVDFGFILSATKKVSENRGDKQYLSRLITAVFVLKACLGVITTGGILTIVCVTDMRNDFVFYALYLFAQMIYAMLPDFLYRGLEDMKIITYRTLAIRAASTVLVFVFVKGPEDYYLVPLFTFLGNAVAIISMYIHAYQKHEIRFARVSFKEVWYHFKDSAQFFASRVACTVYQATNALILSAIYGANSPVTGYYATAEKTVSLAMAASSPVADSLYPYMIKNKNYKLVKKILLLAMPVIAVGVVVLGIFAEPICAWVFGEEYYASGNLVRLLLPYILVVFPNYILAFPVMVPLGLTKYANLSNLVGLGVEVVLVLAFLITGCLNVYTLCIATSITEVAVLLFRTGCVWKRVRTLRKEEQKL